MKLSEWLEENPGFDHDLDLRDGDVVSDVITLARLVRLDESGDALIIGVPDHMTGIMQYGLICVAKLQVEQWMQFGEHCDED